MIGIDWQISDHIIQYPLILTAGNRFKDEAWDRHAFRKTENLFVAGTWNSDFDNEVKPQAADIILKIRNNFNAFEGI